MTLIAEIIPVSCYSTGDLLDIIVAVPSLSGVIEFTDGWVLCNGVILPAESRFANLRAYLGSSHGSYGQVPTLLDGVIGCGQGSTAPPGGDFTADYRNIGAVDGVVNVTLAVKHISRHQHYYTEWSLGTWNGSHEYAAEEAPEHGCGPTEAYLSSANGGGAQHNNMPRYLVVEGSVIKL